MSELSKVQVWAKRVAAFESSGLNRRAWCEQQGLSANTLDYWRSRLRRANSLGVGSHASRALVPMVVAGDQSTRQRIEIILVCGTRLCAPCTVEPAWLSALVRGLSGC